MSASTTASAFEGHPSLNEIMSDPEKHLGCLDPDVTTHHAMVVPQVELALGHQGERDH